MAQVKKAAQLSRQQPIPKKFYFPTWYYILFIAFVCLVFFYQVLLGQKFFWEDLVENVYPARIFARNALAHGQFPHWNPYAFGGMPFFAALQTNVLYPANLLISFGGISNSAIWYLIELIAIAHFFVAGTCMLFLCKEVGISRSSSLFGAISFMLSGFFVCHVIHSNMLFLIAWLPFIMLLLKRGVEREQFLWFLGAGATLGISLFAGHPQIMFYEFLFLGAYMIFLLAQYRTKKPLPYLYCLLTFAIAVGISMMQLLPSVELSAYSVRTNWTFNAASEGSLSIRQLLTLFIPKLFGGLNLDNSEVGFWLNDAFHSGYWTFWETTFYTGIPTLLLGFLYVRKARYNPLALFCVLWFLFSLIVALGNHTPLYHLLFNYVPGFNKFRSPARILFTWNIMLPLCAALSLDEIADRERVKKLFPLLLAACGLCVAIAFFVLSGFIAHMWVEFADDGHMAFAQKQAGIFLLVSILLAGILFLYHTNIINYTVCKAACGGLLLLDLCLFGMGYHQVSYSAPELFSHNSAVASFLKDESRNNLFRAKVRDGGAMLLDRSQGMIDRIQLLEGYDQLSLLRKLPPTTPQKQLDLMNVRYKIAVDYEHGQMRLEANPTALPRARMYYRAKIIDDDSALVRYMMSEAFNPRLELVLEKKPSCTFAEDTGSVDNTVRVQRYEDNGVTLSVHTVKSGMLLLSDIWYPAWQASLDGAAVPVYRADYCLRAVEIPAGEHIIDFTYHSATFRTGCVITLLTLFACVGIVFGMLLYRRKSSGSASFSAAT